ncbi:MAG: endonuclease [Nitrososphaerales archaeon]
MVDDEDYDYLMQWKWYVYKNKIKTHWYAERTDPNKTHIKMHRLIMNTPDGMVVDHINQDGLDNQKMNLRNCFQRENVKNKKSAYNSTSKYLGVIKYVNGWRSNIRINNKQNHLGCFNNELDAARAYNEAAIKHHGEFANLNVI